MNRLSELRQRRGTQKHFLNIYLQAVVLVILTGSTHHVKGTSCRHTAVADLFYSLHRQPASES